MRLRPFAFILLFLAFAPAAAQDRSHWISTWTSGQQIPEDRNAMATGDLQDATLRQVVRVTLGGSRFRVRLSNAFGTAPLRFESIRIARSADPASARVHRATILPVRFNGVDSVVVPAGADYVSDPIDLPVAPLSHVAISFYLPAAPERQTSHPGSRATSYYVHGDRTSASDFESPGTVTHWYQLSGLEVEAPTCTAAIAVIGDSITDGYGVQPNTDTRWPDFLAARLRADPATRHLALLNLGMGGNRLLQDGLGPNAAARFDRDVLMQPGIKYSIIFEGVNDLGTFTRDAPASPEAHRALVADMILALRQMADRARARGIRVIGATIAPYGGAENYHPDAANEADRQAVNAWIRQPGNFDAVIDFDALLRDPSHPERMRPELDSGDHLHPSIAGYRAMAEAVPLALFTDRQDSPRHARSRHATSCEVAGVGDLPSSGH